LFNDETIGCLDVFKVDGAESRLQRADDVGQFFRVGFTHLDVEAVDVGKFLEENRLAFHHRLRCQRADVAKAQNGGAVRHYGDKVATAGIAAGGGGIGLDFKAGLGDTGAVGTAQIAAVGQGLGGADLQFSGFRKLVIVQGRLPRGLLRLILPAILPIFCHLILLKMVHR